MSTELVSRSPAPDFGSAIRQLATARKSLAVADADGLVEIRIVAELVQQAARVQKASALAREAAETRIRAERRLGEMLRKDPALIRSLDLRGGSATLFIELASVPEELYEQTVTRMLEKGQTVLPQLVIAAARRASLKKVETGIWMAFDGVFYLDSDRFSTPQKTWAPTLEQARRDLAREFGMRSDWVHVTGLRRIDDAHSRARRLAQLLSLLSETLHGEALKLVKEAELAQGTAAALLYEAYRAEQLAVGERLA